MGLFWSMQKEPGTKSTTRFFMKDITTPVRVTVKTYNGHMVWDELNDATKPASLAETVIDRRYMAQNVRRLPVKEGRVRGVLFLPEG